MTKPTNLDITNKTAFEQSVYAEFPTSLHEHVEHDLFYHSEDLFEGKMTMLEFETVIQLPSKCCGTSFALQSSTHHETVCGCNVGYTTWHSYTELRTRNPLRSGHAQQFDHLISHHKFLRFPSYGHWQLINDANVSRYLKVRNLALAKIFQTSWI